jgi:hypothetical protein
MLGLPAPGPQGLGGMTVPSRMIRPMWSGESSTPWTGVSNYQVWIERFGSIRSEDRHEGGRWSLHLPSER